LWLRCRKGEEGSQQTTKQQKPTELNKRHT
jgi:hypothetical protein